MTFHWLPVAACMTFKPLMLAYSVSTGTTPTNVLYVVFAYIVPHLYIILNKSSSKWINVGYSNATNSLPLSLEKLKGRE